MAVALIEVALEQPRTLSCARRHRTRKDAAMAAFFLLLTLACGDDKSSKPLPADTVPPARVVDLQAARIEGSDDVTLTWTAPGDDGSEGLASLYDIRYSSVVLNEAGWASATVLTAPAPRLAGLQELLTVPGVPHGTLYFGLKAADEVSNWSQLSNVAAALEPDVTPPGRVTDLATASITSLSVTLTWTAPGDDGAGGQAQAYDLRYSQLSITEANWDEATKVQSVPAPAPGGVTETVTVSGLMPDTEYYIALKTVDESSNWSQLSSVLVFETTLVGSVSQITFVTTMLGASYPDWSPDGATIACELSSTMSPSQVYTLPSAGGDLRRITTTVSSAGQPSWSPDGSKIAFQSDVTIGPGVVRNRLCIMEPVPGAVPEFLVDLEDALVPQIQHVCWSPDGEHIAYTLLVSPSPQAHELYCIPASGGEAWLLADGGAMADITWTPDGSKVVYSANKAVSYDIWEVSVSGGESVQLTTSPSNELYPDVSPDGQLIAFSSNSSGAYNLCVMPASGGMPTMLTDNSLSNGRPSWSPDGSRICFVRIEDHISNLWILRLE